MRTIRKLSILIVIFCTLSCSNDNSSNDSENNATVKDIYICGYQIDKNNKYVATVWKNGVATHLTDGSTNSFANDIVVSGNDVYISGYQYNGNVNVAKVWKNGAPINLTDGSSEARASLITMSGQDVYVVGYVYVNNIRKVTIWKNGVPSTLQGTVTSVAVNNNDIYAAGYENDNAKVWKNGIGTNLTNGNFPSFASDIQVIDNDVYVVGREFNGANYVAKLWKNGIATNLVDGTNANGISIVGNDVYISGYSDKPAHNSKVWKNGEVIWNKETVLNSDIEVIGQDFYLLSSNAANGDNVQVLKNGVPHELTSAINSYGEAMFITTN